MSVVFRDSVRACVVSRKGLNLSTVPVPEVGVMSGPLLGTVSVPELGVVSGPS